MSVLPGLLSRVGLPLRLEPTTPLAASWVCARAQCIRQEPQQPAHHFFGCRNTVKRRMAKRRNRTIRKKINSLCARQWFFSQGRFRHRQFLKIQQRKFDMNKRESRKVERSAQKCLSCTIICILLLFQDKLNCEPPHLPKQERTKINRKRLL